MSRKPELTRRDFVRMMVLGGCGAVVAGQVAGCATVKTYPASVVDGCIELSEQEFLTAANSKNALVLSGAGILDPVALIATGDGEYRAISARCTHQGCTVRPSQDFLRCPCHGSTFDVDGQVLRGPADKALPTFPVAVVGDHIVVDVSGGWG